MFKYIILFSLIIAAIIFNNDYTQSYNFNRFSTVYILGVKDKITPKTKKVKVYSGTGFFVSPNKIITNKHVIHDDVKMGVMTIDGKKLNPKLIYEDKIADLAILEIPNYKSKNIARFDCKYNPVFGEDIYSIGNPLNYLWHITTFKMVGYIDSILNSKDSLVKITKFLGDPKGLRISGIGLQGNSGGPVFNKKGDVIAILTATTYPPSKTTSITFVISSEAMCDILDKNNIQYRKKYGGYTKNMKIFNDVYNQILGSINDMWRQV